MLQWCHERVNVGIISIFVGAGPTDEPYLLKSVNLPAVSVGSVLFSTPRNAKLPRDLKILKPLSVDTNLSLSQAFPSPDITPSSDWENFLAVPESQDQSSSENFSTMNRLKDGGYYRTLSQNDY